MTAPIGPAEQRTNVSGRQLALVLGGLALVLVALWFFVLRGAGGEDAPQGAPAPAGQPAPEPEPEETAAPPGTGGPVETFEIFAAKDPFEPLVDTSTGGTGGTGSTGGGTGDGTGGTGDGGSGTDGSGTIDQGGRNVEGHTVRLVDIFTEGGRQRAQVQVDGTVYTVDEGEVFAENFQLLSISGECATMLYGDDQFTLCEGEEILK